MISLQVRDLDRTYRFSVYGSGFLDWGFRVEERVDGDWVTRFDNPHYLSNDCYGHHANGRAWGVKTWREFLREEAWDLLDGTIG